MIRTWIADVTELREKQKYFYYYKKVPEFRQRKADKIGVQEGKALSIGAWILFQKMKETYQLGGDVVYNLSHSGNYVLCSVEDSRTPGIRLGCDLEEIKQLRLEVARHYFCESEIQYIIQQDTEEEKKEAFYRYWVLKESFMKATRMGMKLGLSEFEIQIKEGEAPCLIKQPEAFPEMYYYKEYMVEKIPYKIAVCSTSNAFDATVHKVIL